MRRLVILIALLCAALAVAAPAQASHAQTMTFEAPRDLKDPSTRDQAFNDIAALGVHSMRLVLYWHDVAPQPDSRIKPKFDETSPSRSMESGVAIGRAPRALVARRRLQDLHRRTSGVDTAEIAACE